MLLNQFLQHLISLAVASYYKVGIWMDLHNGWDYVYKEVNAFPLGKAGDADYVYCVKGKTHAWVWGKFDGVNSVWYREADSGVDF